MLHQIDVRRATQERIKPRSGAVHAWTALLVMQDHVEVFVPTVAINVNQAHILMQNN
jgi:hypothetical protein